jgi:hypothetical protein
VVSGILFRLVLLLGGAMDDPGRIKAPWYLWRWRLGVLLPMVLFGVLGVNSLFEIRNAPVLSIVFGGVFFVFALLFARQVWRGRHPLRSEVRRRTGGAG